MMMMTTTRAMVVMKMKTQNKHTMKYDGENDMKICGTCGERGKEKDREGDRGRQRERERERESSHFGSSREWYSRSEPREETESRISTRAEREVCDCA